MIGLSWFQILFFLIPIIIFILRKKIYSGYYDLEIFLDGSTLMLKDKNSTRRIFVEGIKNFGIFNMEKNGQGVFVKTKSKETRFLVKNIPSFISELKKIFRAKKYTIVEPPRKFNFFANKYKSEVYEVKKQNIEIEDMFKKTNSSF